MSKYLTKEQIKALYGGPVDESGNVLAFGRNVKFHNSAKRPKRTFTIEELTKFKPKNPPAPVIETDVTEIS